MVSQWILEEVPCNFSKLLCEFVLKYCFKVLKGDSRLASSHLVIYVSLFQPTTVISKNVIKLTV